ncbi:MAG: hypothetical protein K0041_09490 [Acidithiobacillus sp.]|nr:hypothetical protein [Acidithiobacillus sp.]
MAAVEEKMFSKERNRGKTAWIRETWHLPCGIEPGGLEIRDYPVHVEVEFVLGVLLGKLDFFLHLGFYGLQCPSFLEATAKIRSAAFGPMSGVLEEGYGRLFCLEKVGPFCTGWDTFLGNNVDYPLSLGVEMVGKIAPARF